MFLCVPIPDIVLYYGNCPYIHVTGYFLPLLSSSGGDLFISPFRIFLYVPSSTLLKSKFGYLDLVHSNELSDVVFVVSRFCVCPFEVALVYLLFYVFIVWVFCRHDVFSCQVNLQAYFICLFWVSSTCRCTELVWWFVLFLFCVCYCSLFFV